MIIIAIIFGLLIGSFLNVCIYRIPREESLAFPPSHCTKCQNRIKLYDLIPVVSYSVLGGKCRYCKEKISIRYPLIEILNGIFYGLIFYKYGFSINFFKFAILSSLLIVIGFIDFDTTDIYLKTILFGAVTGTVFIIIGYITGIEKNILQYIYGGLFGGGVISIIILFTGGMGWGDAEMCFVCGIFLGFKVTIIMLFLSFIIGSVYGLSMIALRKKTRKDYIAFGPSIALAAVTCVFCGQIIGNWYLNML